MHKFLDIDPKIIRIIKELQQSGYETYVVGGAVRDLLLGHIPKDYDISTAATPEEICKVFGRRHTIQQPLLESPSRTVKAMYF